MGKRIIRPTGGACVEAGIAPRQKKAPPVAADGAQIEPTEDIMPEVQAKPEQPRYISAQDWLAKHGEPGCGCEIGYMCLDHRRAMVARRTHAPSPAADRGAAS